MTCRVLPALAPVFVISWEEWKGPGSRGVGWFSLSSGMVILNS